jgi:uncharacterized protein (TIGR03118 family)
MSRAATNLWVVSVSLGALMCLAQPAEAKPTQEINLVTDDQSVLTGLGFTPAAFVDPHLINPWGMSSSPTSPFWVSNQGTSTSTLYNGAGAPQALVVAIPSREAPPSGPTGQVFNAGGGFNLSNGNSALFLFANLDGSISGWNPTAGTNALRAVPPSGDRKASYTGLAIGSIGSDKYLYAPNRVTGKVDVFDSSFTLKTLTGNFVDPGANPNGLIPFNVTNIGDHIWVTYSVAGPDADEAALGSGFVSEFNPDGTFVRRLTEGGPLSSPWGLAIAPSSFGDLGGSLLVGNFSDEFGQINAFSLTDGSFLGALMDAHDNPITIPYLWALQRGNGGNGGSTSSIYFTAGIGDEEHGLLGELRAVPEPTNWMMMLLGFGVLGNSLRRSRARATTDRSEYMLT